MRKYVWILALMGFLLVLIGCRNTLPLSGGHESCGSTGELVGRLNNEDVSWDGTYVGLQPVLSQNAQRVLDMGTNAVPFLLSSLTNHDQYAVAHVLLTMIALPSFPFDSSQWNLLPVKVLSHGHVSYGEKAQAVVRDYWFSRKPVH